MPRSLAAFLLAALLAQAEAQDTVPATPETRAVESLAPRESIRDELMRAETTAALPVTAEEIKSARNAQASQSGGAAFDPALPLGVNGRFAFNYSALWAPSQPVDQQQADLGFVRQNVGVAFPLWFGEGQSLFGSIGVQNILFQTDATLPDSRIPFPENLWDVRGSIVHTKRFANDWSTVLIGSLGSTGDKPFSGTRELIPGLVAVLRIPSGDRNAWLASLSYQPVTGLPFPIPGLAYVWEPNDRLTAQIGIPFQLYWAITYSLRFDASYLPVTNVRAYFTYRCHESFEIFGGFDWVNEAYFLDDRLRDDDFFNLLEQRIPIGLRRYIGPNWLVDAQAGYILNRTFFTGDSIVDEATDRVDVEPGPFGMVRLIYRF